MLDISRTPDGQITILTLNRPTAMNALDGPTLDALDAALDALEADDGKRAMIIAGNGRAFCAGADLKESGIDPIERVERMHALVLRLLAFPKPSVAAIGGFALGGGLELAMACTFRVASPAALLGLPEIRMSLIPGYGGTQLLPRLVGMARATEMILSGDPVIAARAQQIGLVNLVADEGQDVLDVAAAFAAQHSRYGAAAQQAARAAIWNGAALPIEDALKVERDLVARVARSREARVGVGDFREGRRR